MKPINNYIVEKLHLNKDINVSERIWLVLYEYDFDTEDFVWEELDTTSFDEVLDNIDKYGAVYEVYKDVPKDPNIIGEILEAAKDIKFDNISYGKFNNILKKHNVGIIGGDSIWKMIKSRKKRLKREQRKA